MADSDIVCPECQAGKHRNCNGYGGIDDEDNWLDCECDKRGHEESDHPTLWDDDNPAADPGELVHSIVGDEIQGDGIRLDLVDASYDDMMNSIQVQNDRGEWVPVAPLPFPLLPLFLKRFRCGCGKVRWTKKRYYEHYAYAHILGMED